MGTGVTASEAEIRDDDADYAATSWARVHFELGYLFTHEESSNRKCLDLTAGLCHDGDIPKKQPITVKVLGPKGQVDNVNGQDCGQCNRPKPSKRKRAAGKS
jgi:hypothetical protein